MPLWKSPTRHLIATCCVLQIPVALAQTTRPSTDQAYPPDATAAEVLRELSDVRGGRPIAEEAIALRAALSFFIAVGEGAAEKAAGAVDAVGYQELPTEGPLPEIAERPVSREAMQARIGAAERFAAGEFPMARIEVLTRRKARSEFQAATDWMLSDDVLVVFRGPRDEIADGPLRSDALLVIRLRARRPAIVAGTLLQCVETRAGEP